MNLYKKILLRQDQYEKDPERVNADAEISELIEYARSDLEPSLLNNPARGQKRGKKQYTSKIETDLDLAADAFVGNVFLSEGWFTHALPGEENKKDENQAWTAKLDEHFTRVYADNGFYDILPAIIKDKLSIGDGFVYVGEEEVEDLRTELDKSLDESEGKKETVPYYEYIEYNRIWFTRDRRFRLQSVHIRFSMTAMEAFDKWGEKCSDAVKRDAEKHPLEPYNFIQAIYKKTDKILKGVKVEKDRPYIEYIVQEDNADLEKKDDDSDKILEQSGYFSMPVADWPHSLKSRESIARGALRMSMKTVKACHSVHKDQMLKSQREADPPLKESYSLGKRSKTGPGQKTRLKHAGEDIAEIYRGGGAGRDLAYLERLEDQIEQLLGIPFWLMMNNETKRMTIPELMERTGEKAAAQAPKMGLGERVFLEVIHTRTSYIEQKNGRIPPAPESLAEKMKSGEISSKISVKYKGPLYLAQETLFTQRRILGTLQIYNTVAQYDPEAAADKIDVMIAGEHVLDQGKFYPDAIRTNDAAQKRGEARAAIQAGVMQSEQDERDSRTAKNLSETQNEE